MSNLLEMFGIKKKRKKPLPITLRNYEPEEQQQTHNKLSPFTMLVIIGVFVVVVVIAIIYAVFYNTSPLTKIVTAATRDVESGSFSYKITTSLNGKTQMEYKGSMIVNTEYQMMCSVYDATYTDYSYHTVICPSEDKTYYGTRYNNQWTITDSTDKNLDFFDFYRDFSNKKFDAGALLRFMDKSGSFNSTELEKSFSEIYRKLKSGDSMTELLRYSKSTSGSDTTYSFTPKAYELSSLVVNEMAPAFMRADDFNRAYERIENNRENLENTNIHFSYVISGQGYLTQVFLEVNSHNSNYIVKCEMDNFSTATVELTDDFYQAAGIQPQLEMQN